MVLLRDLLASEDVESADGSLNHLPLNFDGLASAETNPQGKINDCVINFVLCNRNT